MNNKRMDKLIKAYYKKTGNMQVSRILAHVHIFPNEERTPVNKPMPELAGNYDS